MGIFGRALRYRTVDLKECLFFVKAKNDRQIQGAGIACAVQMVVRGENKYFLLTCIDVKNKPGRVFAHRYHRSWRKPKQNTVEVENCFEDAKFCFIPLDCIPEKSLKLVRPEDIGKNPKCSSYVITQEPESFKTIKWKYNQETRKYELEETTELPFGDSSALGSPVIWTDNTDNSYVVGVVSRKGETGFFPNMLTTSSLQLPVNPNQPEPDRPDPNRPDPNQPDPNQPDPNRSDPDQPDQPDLNKPDLNQPVPNRRDPNRPDPNQPDPDQPNTNQPDLQQPDPDRPDPNQPDPNQPDPNQPDQQDPNQPDPDRPDPNQPDPDRPDPNQPDPNQPDPNQPDRPDPNQPDPNQPDPNQPDPDRPDPNQPDPNQPDPNQPDPDRPDPNRPDDPMKVPKFVAMFTVILTIVLGILELWFPWLTGRAIKLYYPLRQS